MIFHPFNHIFSSTFTEIEGIRTTMKAVLALVFFACIAGSMASAPAQIVGQIVQQGTAVAQAVFGQLQAQISQFITQALGGLSSLVGSLGGRFDFNQILTQLQEVASTLVQSALGQVLGGLTSLNG